MSDSTFNRELTCKVIEQHGEITRLTAERDALADSLRHESESHTETAEMFRRVRDERDALKAELATERQRARMPDEVAKFLLGEGPLEGVWFGDRNPARKGLYWWRTMLRDILAAVEQGDTR